MRFDFTMILAPETDLSEDVAEALFEAGCDDCSPVVAGGVPLLYFHREVLNLHEAIRSAAADVQRAGCKVAEVRIGAEALPK
jgi:hypothetical protein